MPMKAAVAMTTTVKSSSRRNDMIVVSQDRTLFVNLDLIPCIKIVRRGAVFDILAINEGDSQRLGTYMSGGDAYAVMSTMYVKQYTGWDVMFMPDRTSPTIVDASRGHSDDKPDLNGHSCSTCNRGDGSLGCQYCHDGNMWEPKEE
jgi:hypothetical protein